MGNKIKDKIITGFGSLIALFYTLLMILSVDGLGRKSMVDRFLDSIFSTNFNVLSVVLLTLCLAVLLFYYIAIARCKNGSMIVLLYASFAVGAVFLVLITHFSLVQKYLLDCYILWFYHGVYYEGEEKVSQVFSFILRITALCFCFGGMISFVAIKILKRNQTVRYCP